MRNTPAAGGRGIRAPSVAPGPTTGILLTVAANYLKKRRNITRTRSLVSWALVVGLLLLGLLVVWVLREYYALPEEGRTARDVWQVRIAMFALVVAVTLVLVLLGQRMSRLILALRARRAGSRFHVRLARRFAMIGLLPAFCIAVLALLTVVYGLDRWFSTRVGQVVQESRALAASFTGFLADDHLRYRHAVLAEQLREALERQTPGRDSTSLADRLVDYGELRLAGRADPAAWNAIAGILFQPPVSARRVGLFAADELLATGLSDQTQPDPALPQAAAQRAKVVGPGAPVALQPEAPLDLAAAIWPLQVAVSLPGEADLVLVVDSSREAPLLRQVAAIFANSAEYQAAERTGLGVAWGFALIYGVGAAVVAVAAIMVGFLFADQLVGPIGSLAAAAARIQDGDLSARVHETPSRLDEVGELISTFNEMAQSLADQRQQLLESHEREQEGRLFAEGVLRGTTVGIIGTDPGEAIRVVNRAVGELLGPGRSLAAGTALRTPFPEIGGLMDQAGSRPERIADGEVTVETPQLTRQLRVRVAAEVADDTLHGYVVTLGDVTGRAIAERMVAWKHLAEIMAHEIKNPLNPIRMKAQALEDMVPAVGAEEGARLLAANSELVERKVEEIRRLVDDFRGFASMPQPQLEWVDLVELLTAAGDLAAAGDPAVDFRLQLPAALRVRCDPAQLSRAVANVLVNAALATRERSATESCGRRVELRAGRLADMVEISVRDNGPGFPAGARQRLLEPYVTQRQDGGGTGLGLAVVRWVLESHGGEVLLRDPPDGAAGAMVRLRFPAAGPEAPAGPRGTETGGPVHGA